MTTEKQTLNLDQIRIDGGTQPRVEIDEQVVAEYAEKYGEGNDLKPVIVFYDGATYWLADGFHRYWANKKINSDYIFANIHQGTQRDAILFSVGANATHGLRRTNADKRKAVLIMLKDEEWSQWSNREIAKRCGVSEYLVRQTLENLTAIKSQSESRSRTYTTRHGTSARMKTGNINRNRRKPGGISPKAMKPIRNPEKMIPTLTISIPLNNPQAAAGALLSNCEPAYLRSMMDSITNTLVERGL